MRRLFIPKPNKPGKVRPITIPHSQDIIVMDSLSNVLNKMFEEIFLDCSHGFRKERGTRTCFFNLFSTGSEINHFLSADVVGCFDNINHAKLLCILGSFIEDSRLVNLISAFIKTDILDKEGKNYAGSLKGIPQGSSLSPVLMNIYMHQFDVKFYCFLLEYPDIHYVRYADDLLIAFGAAASVDKNILVETMSAFISELSLELKISIKNNGESFIFLGVLVKTNSVGTVELAAPLARVYRKIKRMGPHDRQFLLRLLVSGDQKDENQIISYYNDRVIIYLSTYCFCSNALDFKELLKRRMRNACIEHLAQLTNTSVVDIKLRYGPNLEKTTVPFISNKRIDQKFEKLREKYEKQKQMFLEAKLIEREKEVNSPKKSFIILLIVLSLVSLLLFIKWHYL